MKQQQQKLSNSSKFIKQFITFERVDQSLMFLVHCSCIKPVNKPVSKNLSETQFQNLTYYTVGAA